MTCARFYLLINFVVFTLIFRIFIFIQLEFISRVAYNQSAHAFSFIWLVVVGICSVTSVKSNVWVVWLWVIRVIVKYCNFWMNSQSISDNKVVFPSRVCLYFWKNYIKVLSDHLLQRYYFWYQLFFVHFSKPLTWDLRFLSFSFTYWIFKRDFEVHKPLKTLSLTGR